jgi:hypothetical protein
VSRAKGDVLFLRQQIGKIVRNTYFFIEYNKLFLLSSTTILFVTYHKLLQDRVIVSQRTLINNAKSSA